MKKVKLEEIIKLHSSKCQESFDTWYSTNVDDWEEDIRIAMIDNDYSEDKDLYVASLKDKRGSKEVETEFYYRYVLDNNGNYQDTEYFID